MKIEVTKTVNIPHADLWAAISDFGGVHKFNPVVETSSLTGDTPNQGVGIQRKCDFYDGNSIVETVTHWEDKKGYTAELSEMNLPFKEAFGSLYVEAIDDKTSKMTMTMEFTPKYGVLGLIMGVLMIRPGMRKLISSVLDGLEHHGKTGDLIGKDGVAIKAPSAAAGPELSPAGA